MDFNGKKICIMGLARSGIAAAERLAACGAAIRISEYRNAVDVPHAAHQQTNIPVEYGGHTVEFCCDSDMIVVSPGVHLDIPVIVEARKREIPVISEVELASMFFTKPIIAITGTNGKTTTTTLIGEVLKRSGYRVAVGGNIGHPLISIDDSNLDYIVAEISSYQLEAIDTFRPHIALILNLTEDHLERYHTMEAYGAAKKRLLMNQRSDDFVVYNDDDPLVKDMVKDAAAKKVPFSRRRPVENGTFINDGYLVRLKENIIETVIKKEEIKIKGDHNVENCLAASAATLLCGVPAKEIAAALRDFNGVEHRIEYVRTVRGVDFLNDSKATNPDSTIVALNAVASDRNVVLILGGRDKGGDLRSMCGVIAVKARSAVLIGEAADRFEASLRESGFNDIERAGSMDEAVNKCFSKASEGDKVLLSPACASFDMFSDYEHRGRVFKEIVRNLSDG